MVKLRQLAILGVIVALTAAATLLCITYPKQVWLYAGLFSGWVLFVGRLLYERWNTFYLLVQKVRYTLFGLDTIWRFSVRYQGEFPESLLTTIRNRLTSLPGTKVTYWSDTRCLVESFGSTISISLDRDPSELDCLEIHFNDLTVTYNKALTMIRKQVLPAIEELEKTIMPEKSFYFFTLTFDGQNPFFGLMLSRVSPKTVSQFNVVFSVDSNRVEVHRDSLTVQTCSLGELREMSSSILSLAPNALVVR